MPGVAGEQPTGRPLVRWRSTSAAQTRSAGRWLARLLRAGDVVVLVGELGAGKTTFAQGIGAELRVRGDVTSPTFVISRVHPSLGTGPALVHVDAYRVRGGGELDDLDLDQTLDDAVTVVEWGDGLADALSESLVRVQLSRGRDDPDDARTISIDVRGPRWAGGSSDELLSGPVGAAGATADPARTGTT